MAANSEGSAAMSGESSTVLTIRLSPAFKLVFASVLGLTILCLILGCSLVGLGIKSDEAKVMFELCTSTFKLGFGAIIGLLGGKAL